MEQWTYFALDEKEKEADGWLFLVLYFVSEK